MAYTQKHQILNLCRLQKYKNMLWFPLPLQICNTLTEKLLITHLLKFDTSFKSEISCSTNNMSKQMKVGFIVIFFSLLYNCTSCGFGSRKSDCSPDFLCLCEQGLMTAEIKDIKRHQREQPGNGVGLSSVKLTLCVCFTL